MGGYRAPNLGVPHLRAAPRGFVAILPPVRGLARRGTPAVDRAVGRLTPHHQLPQPPSDGERPPRSHPEKPSHPAKGPIDLLMARTPESDRVNCPQAVDGDAQPLRTASNIDRIG